MISPVITAGLSNADDMGRRYLIGVAAAVQLAIFWRLRLQFGLHCVYRVALAESICREQHCAGLDKPRRINPTQPYGRIAIS